MLAEGGVVVAVEEARPIGVALHRRAAAGGDTRALSWPVPLARARRRDRSTLVGRREQNDRPWPTIRPRNGLRPGPAPAGDNLLNDFVQESADSYRGVRARPGRSGRARRRRRHADRRGLTVAVHQPGRRSSARSTTSGRCSITSDRSTTRGRRPRSCSTARGRRPTSARSASRSMGHPPLMVRPPGRARSRRRRRSCASSASTTTGPRSTTSTR